MTSIRGGLLHLRLSGVRPRRPARHHWDCASAASLESGAVIDRLFVEFEEFTANPGSQRLRVFNDEDSLDVVVSPNLHDAIRRASDAAIVTAGPAKSPHRDTCATGVVPPSGIPVLFVLHYESAFVGQGCCE